MLNTTPSAVDRAYSLPYDWPTHVLAFTPDNVVAPLVEALQDVIRRRGDAAIAIEDVQELALVSCGLTSEPFFAGYHELFSRLASAAGGNWPVTVALSEQPLKNKPVLDAAQRLVSCYGEWLALWSFIRAGWIPQESLNRSGHDWLVARGERILPVEVKTKQAAGSDLGRLQFALRGLALTPGGAFLNTISWQWYDGDDLVRPATATFYELLCGNLSKIEQLLVSDLPLYDQIEVARTDAASLSLQRSEPYEFALDFLYLDPSASAEQRSRSQVTLVGRPNRHPGAFLSGSSDARFLRDLDDTALQELEEFVFGRLKIVEQAAKRSRETLVLVTWEVPFHWQLDSFALERRWRNGARSLPSITVFSFQSVRSSPESCAQQPERVSWFRAISPWRSDRRLTATRD